MRRAAFYAFVLLAAIIVIAITQQVRPQTTAGVVLNGSSATIPAGERLVLKTFDEKAYATLVREGSDAVVIGMFNVKYPTPLCGTGCSVSVNVVSYHYVTVTQLEDGALQADWSWPVVLQ